MISKSIIGKWNLIKHSQLDEDISGIICYFPDGKMELSIQGKANGLFISLHYSGEYILSSNCIIHEIKNSTKTDDIETKQKRYFQIDKDQLILTDLPEDFTFMATWKRMEF